MWCFDSASPWTCLLSARRREFISLIGGTAAAWPLVVHPQQAATPVVGFLYSSTTDSFREFMPASSPSDIEGAFATLVEQQAGALLVDADTFFVGRRDELVALAARYRIPTSYFRREFAEAGGLISYAATAVEAFRQTGVYVGRILKGENPRDLPVEQSTKFELIINMKTAKALGLTIPPGVLSIADEVIE